MKGSEAHAKAFLEHLGLGPVVYEPNGNRPPDLVTAGGIAVEVRRLNQHYEDEGKLRALEHDDFPLLDGFRRLLATFGPSREGQSWWVSYWFRRPVPKWRVLEKAARELLAHVDREARAPERTIAVHPNFTIRLIPCTVPQLQRFAFSGYVDRNAGGWLIYELQRNLQICSDEKVRKVAPYLDQYDTWWLVLVDKIGHGSGATEEDLIAANVLVRGPWHRLVLLNPSDPTRWVDVRLDAGGITSG
jgi:hypothetical protein